MPGRVAVVMLTVFASANRESGTNLGGQQTQNGRQHDNGRRENHTGCAVCHHTHTHTEEIVLYH